jgi:hypothetical protein
VITNVRMRAGTWIIVINATLIAPGILTAAMMLIQMEKASLRPVHMAARRNHQRRGMHINIKFHHLFFTGVLILQGSCTLAAEQGASNPPARQYNDSHYTITSGPFQGQMGRLFCGLRIEPAAANFGMLPTGASTAITVRVDLDTASQLNITNADLDSPRFQTRLRKVEGRGGYLIDIATKPPLVYGTLNSQVFVRTDEAGRPNLTIPVLGVVTGELDVSTWEIVTPYGDGTPPWGYRYVRLTSRSGQVFNVLKVVPPGDGVREDGIWWAKNDQIIIRLVVDPDPQLDGKYLQILTDVSSMPEIRIRLRRPRVGGQVSR